MKRPLVVIAVVAVAAIAGALAWTTVRRDDEYRRLVLAGDAALANNEPFPALEAFSGAIALRRDSMLGYLRRGEAYWRLGDRAAALRDLRRAAALDPTATRPLERLGDLLYDEERYGPAADRYAAYIRLDDRSSRVLYKLGLARYMSGTPQTAIPPLRQAVHLNDRFAEAFYLLGVCLAAERQTNEAIWALRRSIDIEPRLSAAREVLSNIYRGLNRPSERLDELQTLVTQDSARVDRIVALATAQVEVGRPDLAVATLGRAVERHPTSGPLYAALATVWLQEAEARGDRVASAKALEATRRLILLGEPSGAALALHGRALLLAGQTDAALRALRDATTRLPVPATTFERLATAAMRLGNRVEARDALIRYATLQQDDRRQAETMARVAEISWSLRDTAGAVRWQTLASEHAPRDTALLARLALLQWADGDAAAARDTARRVNALGGPAPVFPAGR